MYRVRDPEPLNPKPWVQFLGMPEGSLKAWRAGSVALRVLGACETKSILLGWGGFVGLMGSGQLEENLDIYRVSNQDNANAKIAAKQTRIQG